METMEQRDVITPSHINSSGKMGRVCLCVFTLGACCVPDGPGDKSTDSGLEYGLSCSLTLTFQCLCNIFFNKFLVSVIMPCLKCITLNGCILATV